MEDYAVTFQPNQITVTVEADTTLLQAQIQAGLRPDAPCGGQGTCGKCRVWLRGQEVLACKTRVTGDMTVWTEPEPVLRILEGGISAPVEPDGKGAYALAFDVGTTTLVATLLDGKTGTVLARSSCANPQRKYGADVISRIRHVLKEENREMTACIREAMAQLADDTAAQAGISLAEITAAAVAGNTAMHHLLLGIDPGPLVTPPYMPVVLDAMELGTGCKTRILPNIAGFVGGDTVGCMVATRFDRRQEMTLLVDIGTNGEMVLGDRKRRIACSTAAGPAFEGAKISCGMNGAKGAVDHVMLEDGKITYHVIGDTEPRGLCGSGLLDLVAVLLDLGIIGPSGRMKGKSYELCPNVVLTQKDVREVQLAKAAIRTGIELLSEEMGAEVKDIRKVYLAGAFGNYLTPASACRIGMFPPELLDRIVPVGNAAGAGAALCALREDEFVYSQNLAKGTAFLELATLPQFRDRYVRALDFAERDA